MKVKGLLLIVIAVLLLIPLGCNPALGSPSVTQTAVPTEVSVPTLTKEPVPTQTPILTSEVPWVGDNSITEFYVHASDPGCDVIDNLNDTILLTIRCSPDDTDVRYEFALLVSEERISTVVYNFRKNFTPLSIDEEWSANKSGESGLLLGGYTSDNVPVIAWTANGKNIMGQAIAIGRDLEYLRDWFDTKGSIHYISKEASIKPEPTLPPVTQGNLITDFFVLASDPSCENRPTTDPNHLKIIRCSFMDGTDNVIVVFYEWVAESAWKDFINSVAAGGNVVLEDRWEAVAENAGTHGPYVAWLTADGNVFLVWGVDGYRLSGAMSWYDGDVAAAKEWFHNQASRHSP
jgi:hypothetical protein